MAAHVHGEIQYRTFDTFDRRGLVHGMFARHGGVSPQPWASLNQGGMLGDPRENVVENRRRIFSALGRQVESLHDCWLVHGSDVICASAPRPLDGEIRKADILLTDRPEVTLYMRYADCVPVLLYDPGRQVIGLVHAGWRGTVDRVAAVAVQRMAEVYGTRPADILAGIGPSISVTHYEIGKGSEAAQRARESFFRQQRQVLDEKNGTLYFDLWRANQIVLEACGVRQIENCEVCTYSNHHDWFSHRAEQGKTGRFGVLLALPPA